MKEKIEEIIKKVKDDPKFMDKFKENPAKAVEEVIGVELPCEQVNKIVDGVKAKISIDNGNDALDKIKGLFNK